MKTLEVRILEVTAGKRDIISALETFSNKEQQFDSWMNVETPGVYSLEEEEHALLTGVSRVIGDSLLEDVFSYDLCLKLACLEKVIRYNESKHLDSKKTIDHPKMIEMRELSSEILPMFKKELENNERFFSL